MRAWILAPLAVALLVVAAEARAGESTAQEQSPETAVRANPRIFARPPALTTFPRNRDPFQIARGPIEIRDEFLLAQVRLTLPSTSPDPLPNGRWLLRLHDDWGNDFGFSQTGPAEGEFSDRRFLVDGERHTVEAHIRRGFGRGIDVGLRVPVRWRGGGFMDGLIEWWHDRFGLKNNSRGEFDQDRYRVEGRDDAFNPISWTEESGWGLGNVELDARWAFVCPRCRDDLRAALIGRVGLPTGTGPYETGGVDAGLQVVAAKQLWRRFDVYAGVGGTWYSEAEIRGVLYETWRAHGFFALEWRFMANASLLVQTDASSRLVTNLTDYPGIQWYLLVGGKFDLGGGWRVSGGMTENLQDQQSTVDVGFFGSLEVLF